ncbi:response regulator [Promicromonospora sp. Populi]|uniref:response regulator n=1 Tax=Promicromonospora sp. Populi TaxID=3239420 RepID=UPI0034E1D892
MLAGRDLGQRISLDLPPEPGTGSDPEPDAGLDAGPDARPDTRPDAGLSDAAGRCLVRAVQEGLVNAAKHAPGTPVTVRLEVGPGHCAVVVENSLAPDADGQAAGRRPGRAGRQPGPERFWNRSARHHPARGDARRRARRRERRRPVPPPGDRSPARGWHGADAGSGGRINLMTDLTVLLVDDDPLVCGYLQQELDAVDGVRVVGTAREGAEAVDLATRTRPDVVLMDIRMPGVDGIDAAAALTRSDDGPAVVLMTTVDSDQALVAGLRAGARGFTLKTAPVATIIEAIRAAARGMDVLSPEATQRLLRLADGEARPASDPRVDALTEREREVLNLVGEGHSNADVARTLYLAESTVKGHVSRLMEKLGCANRTQLAVLAQRSA